MDNAKMLAIAHYNCGAEFEYLKQFNSAMISFSDAYQTSCEYLGKTHSLAKRSMKAFQNNKKRININYNIISTNQLKTVSPKAQQK